MDGVCDVLSRLAFRGNGSSCMHAAFFMCTPFLIVGAVFWSIGGNEVGRIDRLQNDAPFAAANCSVLGSVWLDSREDEGSNQGKSFDNKCFDRFRYNFTTMSSPAVLVDDSELQPRLDASGDQCKTCDGGCSSLRGPPFSGVVECWVPTVARSLIDSVYECPAAQMNSGCIKLADPQTRLGLGKDQFSEWKVRLARQIEPGARRVSSSSRGCSELTRRVQFHSCGVLPPCEWLPQNAGMIACICGICGFVLLIALSCMLGVEAPEACCG